MVLAIPEATPTMKRQSGFTLVELVVTVAVVSVIAMQAVPAMRTAVTNSRLMSAAQTTRATAQAARDEAIRRNETIRLESTGTSLKLIRAADTASPETLREVVLGKSAAVDEFTLDYGSNGLTVPFGSEQDVSVAVGVVGCGEDLRCPRVTLAAGGSVEICPTGSCK